MGIDKAVLLGIVAFIFTYMIELLIGYNILLIAVISESIKIIAIIELIKRINFSPVAYGFFCGFGYAIANIIYLLIIYSSGIFGAGYNIQLHIILVTVRHITTTTISASALHRRWLVLLSFTISVVMSILFSVIILQVV